MSGEKKMVSRNQAERLKAAGFVLKTKFGYGISGDVDGSAFHYGKGRNWNECDIYATCPSTADVLSWAMGMRGMEYRIEKRKGCESCTAILYAPSRIIKIFRKDYASAQSGLVDLILDELEISMEDKRS